MSIQSSLNQILGSVESAVHAKATADVRKQREARIEAAALEKQKKRAATLQGQRAGMKERREMLKSRPPRTGSQAWLKEQPSSLGGKLGDVLGPDVIKQIQQKYREQVKQEKGEKKNGKA